MRTKYLQAVLLLFWMLKQRLEQLMVLAFIWWVTVFSMGELKWNTLRKLSIPTSFLATIKLRTFNLRLILDYNLPKGRSFCFLMKLQMFLSGVGGGKNIVYGRFVPSIQVPLLASEPPPSTWAFHLLLGIPCVLWKHCSESMLSPLNIAWYTEASSSYLKLSWPMYMKSILVRGVRTEGCSV